jgi:hypothetical protein
MVENKIVYEQNIWLALLCTFGLCAVIIALILCWLYLLNIYQVNTDIIFKIILSGMSAMGLSVLLDSSQSKEKE